MVRKLIKHEILRTGPLLGLILGVGTLTVLGSTLVPVNLWISWAKIWQK